MSVLSIEQGIAAIQAGRLDEGARLLKIALRDTSIAGPMRAAACLWLVETLTDPAEKRRYYEEALQADPSNPQVKQRVEAFLATQPPLPPTPSAPPGIPMPPTLPGMPTSSPFAPAQPAPLTPTAFITPAQSAPAASAIVMIVGGPNGNGSGFYVAREGLIATSRLVVGGADQVRVQFANGAQINGQVVRAFPEYDLAFIYVEQHMEPLPMSPLPSLPPEAPIRALSGDGRIMTGKRRSTKRALTQHWFPTDIKDVVDAGGGPVLDGQNMVVGMITQNTASTSGYVFGLASGTIRRLMEHFRQESAQGGRVYCQQCGHFSMALAAGGYYCEQCGGLTPRAEGIIRFPQPQLQGYYFVVNSSSCPHCHAAVGFHNNTCLRCGQAVSVGR
jgi:S1-C subfamily serine protease